MTVYALYSIKGGVGKTASTVNLAWLSAEEGKKTLVWDLDPQGSSTFYFRIRQAQKSGVKALIKGKRAHREIYKYRRAFASMRSIEYKNRRILSIPNHRQSFTAYF